MRKMISLPLVAVLVTPLLVSAPSYAEDGAYVGLRGGAGYDVDIPETNFGYRVELEGGYQQSEVDSHDVAGLGNSGTAFGDTSVKYGFVNAYADFTVLPNVDLFAGGGAGVGEVRFDAHGTGATGRVLNDKASAWGYHLDAGASYAVSENVSVETMYRWQNFVDADLRAADGSDTNLDLESHNLYAGLRYKF